MSMNELDFLPIRARRRVLALSLRVIWGMQLVALVLGVALQLRQGVHWLPALLNALAVWCVLQL